MRRYGLLFGLMFTGCATLTRPLGANINPETGEFETPVAETVYLAPAEDAMMTARRILESERYDVLEKEGGLEMFTSAHEPGRNTKKLRTLERYYVKGERLGPRQTLVRVFRLRYNEMDNVVEVGPRAWDSMNSEILADQGPNPLDARMEAYGSAPGGQGAARPVPLKDPFPSAPGMERFRMVQGVRDLGIERQLLERMEMVPALELVDGNAPVSVRSVQMEGWGANDGPGTAECGAPVDGASPLLAAGQVLFIADPLGAQEVPSMALRMLCEATSKGLPVTLGLTVPASEQPLLERYLASEGKPEDAQALLLESTFWRRVYQDGRSSRAMLWLVEQVRRLRVSGKDVALAAIDGEKVKGNAREARMASNLLAVHAGRAQAWTLVLTGSVHARTARVGWDSDFEPFGARVAKALPSSVRALDVGFKRGTQYACRYSVWDDVECNVFGISPTNEALQFSTVSPGVRLFDAARPDGFHGRLFLGVLNASPPALLAQSQVR
ncbi:hypothetical protein LXT21_34090 [Myxococcus sp. K38C18041901]|uniref:hypothetical protein n=1 Tax=Myxococcus guangdongensis TaxID=2906760 RepID=UPI0020A8338A|nr:hypothetical protein [Myxococcus guangdongensis]MCP3063818.1 hypothetical protein [Myxococcus guangdongensis]